MDNDHPDEASPATPAPTGGKPASATPTPTGSEPSRASSASTGEPSAEPAAPSRRAASPPFWAGPLAGILGAGVALAFGQLMDGASERIPSLVVAVGELVADYTPGDVVAASIANLGSSQKTVLTAGIVIASLLIGGLLGRSAARGRQDVTIAGFALFGLLGGWAAARNPFSPAFESWLVALAAAALGLIATLLLTNRASALAEAPAPARAMPPEPAEAAPAAASEPAERAGTRRAFFAYATGAAATALAMIGIGRQLRGPSAAEQARAEIVLPEPRAAPAPSTSVATPSTTAAIASSGDQGPTTEEASPSTTAASPSDDGSTASDAETSGTADTETAATTAPEPEPPVASVREQVAALDTLDDEIPGISTYISPNDGFYRIDTALVVPQVDPAGWRLRFTGMVDNPYEVTFDEILAMDLSDHVITLSCVSNRVGGNLVGNARWTGVPLAELLDRAGVQPGAGQVVGRSVDDWTAGFPTSAVYDGRDAILAVGMNGEPLPTRHGFPARLVIPGLYGYVSAVKWIEEINLTTWDGFDAYWVPRGWSKEGPMKTQSRIDLPSAGSASGLVAGQAAPIAGIAWAPTRGISAVEVDVDGEGWEPCVLGEALGNDSWVQWHRDWTPTAGRHRIRVRATDGDGELQPQGPKDPRPDGAEGWHLVTVNVSG